MFTSILKLKKLHAIFMDILAIIKSNFITLYVTNIGISKIEFAASLSFSAWNEVEVYNSILIAFIWLSFSYSNMDLHHEVKYKTRKITNTNEQTENKMNIFKCEWARKMAKLLQKISKSWKYLHIKFHADILPCV